MKSISRLFFFILILINISLKAQTPNGSDLAKISVNVFDSGSDKYLSVSLKNEKKWHTYWANPGDAGLPTEISFAVDGKKINTDLLEWPTPKKYIEAGDLLTIGYSGLHSFFYKINQNFQKQIENKELTIHSKYLICKNICIPGEKKVTGTYTNNTFSTKMNDFSMSTNELTNEFTKVPVTQKAPDDLDISLIKYDRGLALVYQFNGNPKEAISNLYTLTPYPQVPFAFKRETLYKDKKGNSYALYTIDWDGEFMEPEIPLPNDGVFKTPYQLKFLFNDPINKKVYTIEKTFDNFKVGVEKNFKDLFSGLTPIKINEKIDTDNDSNDNSDNQEQRKNNLSDTNSSNKLVYFFFMALIGGLILNIMPCVLPVISIKLFGLVTHSGESKKSIFKHNMAYSLGVIFTFFVLASVVILLKGAGEQVGWGFQLQSPLFVAIMIFVIFVMALNMFGLFEFRTPGGSKLGSMELKDTFLGDFFGGVLATILSTPCSAPFLGTALTFAFSESNTVIFLIFFSIGLGLALPFILTAFFPALINFLPKPGMWMEHVKKFLALTLILTTLWLLDVFLSLTGSQLALFKMNTALTLIFFVFYVRAKVTKNFLLSALLVIPMLLLFYQSSTTKVAISSNSGSSILNEKASEGLPWKAWSEEEMNKLMDDKSLTFIDFTAKWCITCKVNEKLVLDTDSFKSLVKEKNMKLLLGDWTRRDPIIGEWLKKNGSVGVPAYFVINSEGELIRLGETITIDKIRNSL
ncbi:MAG: thioredoxin family protein [Bdellovibrionota bacterium]|nr:thioredoxin family protein [Bdellovibrionota bacterium]